MSILERPAIQVLGTCQDIGCIGGPAFFCKVLKGNRRSSSAQRLHHSSMMKCSKLAIPSSCGLNSPLEISILVLRTARTICVIYWQRVFKLVRVHKVPIERSMKGWKESEYKVTRVGADVCIVFSLSRMVITS